MQFAALPFRMGADGQPQVLLLTSRETKRWVIPKGCGLCVARNRARSQHKEAFEEAGLVGALIGRRSVGSFHYTKELASGEEASCARVKVFLLLVEKQLDDWPECEQRETRWFGVVDAATLVEEGGLAEILRRSMSLVAGARS